MEVIISDQFNIPHMQEQFRQVFPYLKLEFFAQPYQRERASIRHIQKNDHTLGDIRKQNTPETHALSLSDDMTVTELEALFGTHYGLGVQLFRKSGRIWLETTVTDSWTLEEQNTEGEALSREMR